MAASTTIPHDQDIVPPSPNSISKVVFFLTLKFEMFHDLFCLCFNYSCLIWNWREMGWNKVWILFCFKLSLLLLIVVERKEIVSFFLNFFFPFELKRRSFVLLYFFWKKDLLHGWLHFKGDVVSHLFVLLVNFKIVEKST